MTQAIFIVGGLKDDPDRESVLHALRKKTGDDVEWEWYQALEGDCYLLSRPKLFEFESRLKRSSNLGHNPRVVKLYLLHQQTQNSIYKTGHDPIAVPKYVESAAKLVEWLLSAEANLIPQREWLGNAEEAAIIAVYPFTASAAMRVLG